MCDEIETLINDSSETDGKSNKVAIILNLFKVPTD